MVDCICWNDESNMMVAIGNGKLQIWYYPNAAFVDRDALPKTMFEKEARYVNTLNGNVKIIQNVYIKIKGSRATCWCK
jgi:hypothetical protein